MRRLPIHPELAAELWCHHWSARSPRLPQTVAQDPGTVCAVPQTTRQLSLEAVLPQF
ncbi:hypothetical protein [Aphanothece stagnina]